jgi:ribulose-phosphate 3-epimerase
MIKLAPSILSADFAALYEDIKKTIDGGAHLLHIDVMDGHFVPNISIGPLVVKALSQKVDIPFDVHLMIENPDQYLEDFYVKNTEIITVHAEACVHLHRTVQHIKNMGIKAGVVLNPATPLSVLDYVIEDLDMVLIMSVNPGFGGQSFIESSLEKIKQLKRMIEERDLTVDIQVDGGINLDNMTKVMEAGANILVAGSAIFGKGDGQLLVIRSCD